MNKGTSMRFKRLAVITLLAMSALASGCWSSARYQTANTLDPGQTSFGAGFQAVNLRDICVEAEVDGTKKKSCAGDGDTSLSDVWIPNLMPDLFFRFGLAKDLDMGIKLLFIGGEVDVKYRLVDTGKVKLAIAPAAKIGFPFIVVQEYSVNVPLIFTVNLGSVELSAAAGANLGMWNIPFTTDESLTTSGFNAQIGASFGGQTWYIRPEVGYTANFMIASDNDATVGLDMDWIHVGLGFGFIWGEAAGATPAAVPVPVQ